MKNILTQNEKTAKGGIAMIAAVIVVIIIVAAIGVGAYYYVGKSSKSSTNTQSTTTLAQQTMIPVNTSTTSVVASSTTMTSSEGVATNTSTSEVMNSTSAVVSETSMAQTSTAMASTSSSSSAPSSTTAVQIGSTSSYSCTSTGSTATAIGQTSTPNFAPLFASFSAMSMTETVISNGTTTSIVASYTVQSQSGSGSSAAYSVVINETAAGNSIGGSAVYLGDGTVQSLTFEGQTLTGSEATAFFSDYMTAFSTELNVQATYQEYLASTNLVKVNSTTISIGPSTASVTNYKSENTPFTVSGCGTSTTINNLVIQTGQVQGSSYGTLVTAETFDGSSSGTAFNYTFQITSITKA